jgi:NitT/TauT family transport system substrate-binding protein
MPVTLQENLRGVLYTPFYAALALGAYRREGVTIEFVSAPEPARAVEGLFDGTVDIAWGGPMRVIRPMTAGRIATLSASAKQ